MMTQQEDLIKQLTLILFIGLQKVGCLKEQGLEVSVQEYYIVILGQN